MHFSCKHFCFFAALMTLAAGCNSAPHPQITQEELVRRTQEMMDSLVPGDQTPWKKYFAEDAMYFDEKGNNMDKAALVNDISPMPTGYSGTIKIVSPQTRVMGNTAILSYDMDETETIFGQNLTARYHATDTWMFRDGTWQIVAGQVFRYYEDPAQGIADPKKYNQYVGTYELAPGKTLSVLVKDGSLLIQKAGREPQQLFTESGDVFFRKGVEGRTVFRRNANGSVDALLDRRNNEDVLYKKVS